MMEESENQNLEQKKEFEPAFNSSVLTLQRIDVLIKHISIYRVNDHIIGYRNNLDELFVESQGFLSKEELKKARKDWDEIENMPIVINDDEDSVTFLPELKNKLDKFNSWLRIKLHKHGVTMASKQYYDVGIEKLKRRYGF